MCFYRGHFRGRCNPIRKRPSGTIVRGSTSVRCPFAHWECEEEQDRRHLLFSKRQHRIYCLCVFSCFVSFLVIVFTYNPVFARTNISFSEMKMYFSSLESKVSLSVSLSLVMPLCCECAIMFWMKC